MSAARHRPARTAQPGDTTTLPDGPTGTVVTIDHGAEHGTPVRYVTVRNGLGSLVTRWVTLPGHQGPQA